MSARDAHAGHGCAPRRGPGPTPFERGAAELAAGRRTVLAAGLAGLVGLSPVVLSGPASGAPARAGTKRRAYVLVVDGCRPEEIGSGLMPTLQGLRDGGTNFPRARSLPVMETIPNHTMMMTGVRPDRSGVPANSVYDRAEQVVRDLDRESDMRATTVIERLNARGLRTGTVLSKEYLYGIFGERATYRWEPAPIVPVSGHAPDVFTMDAALEMLDAVDPHLMFVNLGDVDRVGHSDLSGTTLKVARTTALASTDLQVSRFVDALTSSGRWEHSLVIVLADHSMDWSIPTNVVSLQPALDADPLLGGNTVIADNGGADLVYWTGPEAQRERAVARMLEVCAGVDGVLEVHDRREPALRLGPEAGEIVAFCEPGWRFSDPSQTSNPIPGNHGHPATEPIPFFLAGGHPVVGTGLTRRAVAHTMDVAPTVAEFFGLGTRTYDGRSRL